MWSQSTFFFMVYAIGLLLTNMICATGLLAVREKKCKCFQVLFLPIRGSFGFCCRMLLFAFSKQRKMYCLLFFACLKFFSFIVIVVGVEHRVCNQVLLLFLYGFSTCFNENIKVDWRYHLLTCKSQEQVVPWSFFCFSYTVVQVMVSGDPFLYLIYRLFFLRMLAKLMEHIFHMRCFQSLDG